MRAPNDEDADEEMDEEDGIALRALRAILEIDGDDDLADAQREALALAAQEAMRLKGRRMERDRMTVHSGTPPIPARFASGPSPAEGGG